MTAPQPARRPAPPPDRGYIERAAHAYLARFATSRANLVRVLAAKARRRTLRAGRDWTADAESEAAAWIGDVVATLERVGVIDDRVYAEGRVRALARRGRPGPVIRAALTAKGVDADTVDAALASVLGGPQARRAAELDAACRYARRRRLGPWRAGAARQANRARDLAALGRRGFSYDTARTVVEAADADALEQAVAEAADEATAEGYPDGTGGT